MALIKCPECSNDVSERAISCPKCGHPFQSATQRTPASTTPARTDPNGKLTPEECRAGAVALVTILVVIITFVYTGNVHIISGGHLGSPRVVKKESFGLSENRSE